MHECTRLAKEVIGSFVADGHRIYEISDVGHVAHNSKWIEEYDDAFPSMTLAELRLDILFRY